MFKGQKQISENEPACASFSEKNPQSSSSGKRLTLWTCTFAEVLGIEGQAVSRQGLQQQLVAGPPAGLRDGRRHALHRRHALEERRLAVEADELVELRQDAVALDLLLLRQLRVGRRRRVGQCGWNVRMTDGSSFYAPEVYLNQTGEAVIIRMIILKAPKSLADRERTIKDRATNLTCEMSNIQMSIGGTAFMEM